MADRLGREPRDGRRGLPAAAGAPHALHGGELAAVGARRQPRARGRDVAGSRLPIVILKAALAPGCALARLARPLTRRLRQQALAVAAHPAALPISILQFVLNGRCQNLINACSNTCSANFQACHARRAAKRRSARLASRQINFRWRVVTVVIHSQGGFSVVVHSSLPSS